MLAKTLVLVGLSVSLVLAVACGDDATGSGVPAGPPSLDYSGTYTGPITASSGEVGNLTINIVASATAKPFTGQGTLAGFPGCSGEGACSGTIGDNIIGGTCTIGDTGGVSTITGTFTADSLSGTYTTRNSNVDDCNGSGTYTLTK